MSNKYHFTLSIHFKSDYDVSNLENVIHLKPYKTTRYDESKGNVKSAKFLFKTDVLTDIYADELFESFIKQIQPRLKGLKNILKNNNGSCVFRIVFDELNEKPCISLNYQTISILNDLSANFEVEF